MKTIAPPEIIPAKAPCQLERFQNNAKRTTGPNTAPKPAHAKDTILKTELFGSTCKEDCNQCNDKQGNTIRKH